MNRESYKALLVTVGALVFNAVFWQEKMAVNMVIFDAFVLMSVFFLYPGAFARPLTRWLLLLHLVPLAAVVVHNTLLSKLACNATLLLLVVFVQYLHRSVWYAAGSALLNAVLMVVSFIRSIPLLRGQRATSLRLRRFLRFAIIPLLIAALFAGLYALGNHVFMKAAESAAAALSNFFSRFMGWFSLPRLLFLLAGLFLTGTLLLHSGIRAFAERDARQQDGLQRSRRSMARWQKTAMFDVLHIFMGRFAGGILALRNEQTVGIISLVMLNVLLCCINVIDIVYVWFGFTYSSSINLSEYVHEGAGMLVFSIVLAMLVLLFFFRGNLNFYRRNKWLRRGAYLWIAQNVVLVISVMIRDYWYFAHMGMAYKRIGLLVFLLMVLAGLLTVFIKIHYRKTNYYLLRVNGLFAVVLLALCSCVHWDEVIARSNLARKGTIPVDVNFLLSLSDKTLPVIEQHKEVLDSVFLKNNGEITYLRHSRMSPPEYFEYRKRTFFEEQQDYSWLSWNMADAYIKERLPVPAAITTSLK